MPNETFNPYRTQARGTTAVVAATATVAAVAETPPVEAAQAPAAQPAPALAPAAEPNKSVWVLTDTGDARFNSLLVGAVGTVDANDSFQLDTDYKQLSYFFTLAPGSGLPLIDVLRPETPEPAAQEAAVEADPASEAGNQVEVVVRTERGMQISMPAAAADALKINLIQSTSQRWGQLYDDFLRQMAANSMPARMLTSERDTVATAVGSYIQAKGLQAWDVPLIVKATVHEEDPELRPKTERGLLASATAFRSIVPDITREASLAPEAAPQATDAAADPGLFADPSLSAETLMHRGPIDLTAEGSLRVLAPSAEVAQHLAVALLTVANQAPVLVKHFQIQANVIQHLELMASTDTDEDDDRYDHEVYR